LCNSFNQPQIKESLENIGSFHGGGKKFNAISDSILFMICKDMQPFRLVENEGFRHLMKTTSPLYKLPGRDFFSRKLDAKYDLVSIKIKEKLVSIKYVTITTDVWSDIMQARSFLRVTIHFIDGLNLTSFTLGVYDLEERHAAEYLAQKLTETCTLWGIRKESVTAVVTDSGANIVKAVLLLANMCTYRVVQSLYKAHVRCKLEYAGIVWSPIYNNHTWALKKIQTHFAKCLVFNETGQYPPRGLQQETLLECVQLHSLASRWDFAKIKFLSDALSFSFECPYLLSKLLIKFPAFNCRRCEVFELRSARTNVLLMSPLYQRCHVNWTPKTGPAKTGRRNLDARQLDACDNWTRATFGRVRQFDGGRMRHALKLFHNI
jgi:hypothetical protein